MRATRGVRFQGQTSLTADGEAISATPSAPSPTTAMIATPRATALSGTSTGNLPPRARSSAMNVSGAATTSTRYMVSQ